MANETEVLRQLIRKIYAEKPSWFLMSKRDPQLGYGYETVLSNGLSIKIEPYLIERNKTGLNLKVGDHDIELHTFDNLRQLISLYATIKHQLYAEIPKTGLQRLEELLR